MMSRLAVFFALLALLGAAVLGLWRYGYSQAMAQAAARGEADLTLAADRLVADLQRFQDMSVLLASHPAMMRLAEGGSAPGANQLLLRVADTTGALDMVFAGRQGQVLAAAQPGQVRDLAGSAAFRRALSGVLGRAYGYDPVAQKRVYELAAPSFGADRKVAGVLISRIGLADLEWQWSGGGPPVFFTDAAGEVVVTNRSELLDRGALPPPERHMAAGGHEVWRLEWGPYVPRRALHLTRPLPVLGMQVESLVDLAPARRLAGLQAAVGGAVLLGFVSLLALAGLRRRALARINAALEARVARRTADLSRTNALLRQEVHERREAEEALRKAQADLVQAGKLSALGQMSAGISHELNQPLMAIEQFAANGTRFLERAQPDKAAANLGRIEELARRMARIIRNLRAFARNEAEPSGKVDIVAVIDSALELTGPRRRKAGAALDWQPPAGPVFVRGGEVRLAQVLVNLITNALDAMAGQEAPRLAITLSSAGPVELSVSDTGPGIAQPEKLFEPFYTTKEVGDSEGMGLGLSISYGLVQSFGGQIRGENTGQGARFTVVLEPWHEEQAA